MKQKKKAVIIGLDHGYGNIKTVNHCFKSGILSYESEPLFTKNMLVYGEKFYLIGEGHKEFIPEKQNDEEYFLFTLVGIAEELADEGLTEADVILAVGLPLTWMTGQKEAFAKYQLSRLSLQEEYRNNLS